MAVWTAEQLRAGIEEQVRVMTRPAAKPHVPHHLTDPWVQLLRWAIAAVYCVMGAGLAFGPDPWRASPSFEVIAWWLPGGMRTWGAVYLAIGILLAWSIIRHLYSLLRVLLILGSAIIMATAASFAGAALLGRTVGITGPPLWAFFSFVQVLQAGRVHRTR